MHPTTDHTRFQFVGGGIGLCWRRVVAACASTCRRNQILPPTGYTILRLHTAAPRRPTPPTPPHAAPHHPTPPTPLYATQQSHTHGRNPSELTDEPTPRTGILAAPTKTQLCVCVRPHGPPSDTQSQASRRCSIEWYRDGPYHRF